MALSLVIISLTGIICIEAGAIRSTYTKDDSIEAISIKIATSASIRGTYVSSADWDILLTRPSLSNGKDACIKLTSVVIAYIRSGCTEVISVSGFGTIKYLGIYLQFFRILVVKLFGTWLKTRVGACW